MLAGEPIYVGKGNGRRARSHLKRTDMHPFVQRLQKMVREGVEPTIIYLAEDVDDELALLVEEEAIALYGRKDLGKGPLLNLTNGGEGCGGVKRTEEQKQRLSKALKGTPRPWLREANLGRKWPPRSEEHRKRISESLKGKPISLETKAKLSQSLKGVNKGRTHKRITCTHCGKEGGNTIMRRWHFDKCKEKNNG